MRRAVLLATLLCFAGCAGPSGAASQATAPASSATTGNVATSDAATHNFVVFFESWSVGLQPAAIATIGTAARAANAEANTPVSVTGYADPTGGKEVNLLLSETRAQMVIDQLIADGVAAARIHRHARGIVGYTLTTQESRRAVIAVGRP